MDVAEDCRLGVEFEECHNSINGKIIPTRSERGILTFGLKALNDDTRIKNSDDLYLFSLEDYGCGGQK